MAGYTTDFFESEVTKRESAGKNDSLDRAISSRLTTNFPDLSVEKLFCQDRACAFFGKGF